MYSYYTETDEEEASRNVSIRINNVPIESPDLNNTSSEEQQSVVVLNDSTGGNQVE